MTALYVLAGAIGLFVFGLPGALIAVGLLWLVLRSRPLRLLRDLTAIQRQFQESAFAVMGALAKADGQVTRDEIEVAERFFERMNLAGASREAAKAAFNRGKAPEFDLEAELDAFRARCGNSGALVSLFVQMQLAAIAADGVVDSAERELLGRIATRLGLSDADLSRLEAMLGIGAGTAAADPEAERERARQALGVSADADAGEIRRAFRKEMNANHPDKLAARGLPESMRSLAEERTRELIEARDILLGQRGDDAS